MLALSATTWRTIVSNGYVDATDTLWGLSEKNGFTSRSSRRRCRRCASWCTNRTAASALRSPGCAGRCSPPLSPLDVLAGLTLALVLVVAVGSIGVFLYEVAGPKPHVVLAVLALLAVVPVLFVGNVENVTP